MANEIYHRSNWGNAVNDIAWGDVYEKFDATNEMFVRSDYYENSNETDKLMAAINPKPSILLTPTAYDNGSLHSVKPVSFTSLEPTFYNQNGWSWDGSILLGSPATGNTSFVNDIFLDKKNFIITFKVLTYVSGDLGYRFGGGAVNFNYFNSELIEGNTIKLEVQSDATVNNFQFLTNSFNGSLSDITFKQLPAGDFDFTRGSSATRVNAQGLIEDVQILSGNLVQNGDFSQIGSELITNGTFDNNINGWSQYVSTSTWDNGTIKTTSTSNLAYIRQNNVFTQNKQYKVTFKAKATNITHNLKIYNGSSFIDTGLSFDVADTYKEFTYYLNFVGSTINLIVGQSNINNGDSINFDNISVKEVGQNWTFGTDWSMGDGKAVRTGTTSSGLTQSGSFNNGKKYKLQFTISDYVGGSIKGEFSGGGGSDVFFTSNNIGNGTFSFITETTTNRNTLQFYVFSSFVGSIDNVSVIEITDDTDLPRINYTNGEGSLLLENQSTNTATYSNDFTQGDIFNGSNNPNVLVAVLTSQQAISPDGTNNAWLLKDDSDGAVGQSQININGVNVNSNDFNTISIFVKKALTNDFFALTSQNFDSSANGTTWFNISNGTLGTIDSNHTAKIEDYGNGWYRCQITFKSTTDLIGAIKLRLADTNGNNNVTRNGTNGVYLYGLQCEADATQNYATSYIPTNGSTVTRLADVCNNAGSSDLINSEEGVLYFEAKTDNIDVGSISINNGTSSVRITARFRPDISRIQMTINGSTDDFNYNSQTITLSEYNKIAIVYNNGQYYFFVNGVKSIIQNKGTFSANSFTQMDFNRGGGSEIFYGNVKTVAVFKEALSDTELQKLTTI